MDFLGANGVAAGEEQRFADDVFQLAHVARPGLLLQKLHGFGMDGRLGHAEFGAVRRRK